MTSSVFKHNSEIVLVLSVIFISASSLTIRNVTNKNNKTETLQLPDWVPFKNNLGEELGEFKSAPKSKPKKRLAMPANFVLKAVSDDSDDYYEKSMGGSEDNYEFKDWSDTNRPANTEADETVHHTDISDIDGVVNIIINPKDNPKDAEVSNDKSKRTEEQVSGESGDSTEKNNKRSSGEEETDYEDTLTEKNKVAAEEEKNENEAKKAFILKSVDELKTRHAEEARALSEKMKEEEVYKEELERDKVQSEENHDKYGHIAHHKADYDDYDVKETSLGDKYKINPLKRKATTTKLPVRSTKRRHLKNDTTKRTEHSDGKLSVFKHPRAYMVFDYEDNEKDKKSLSTNPPVTTRKPHSSRYKKNKNYTKPTVALEDNVRIKFVAGDIEGKEEEPTLFFPIIQHKKGKHKSGKKSKTGVQKNQHTKHLALETLQKSTSKAMEEDERFFPKTTVTGNDEAMKISATADDGTGPGETAVEYLSSPSAPESLSVDLVVKDSHKNGEDQKEAEEDTASSAASAPASIADTHLASTEHHKEAHKDHKYKKGGEKEHSSHHEESAGESGKKAYEGIHKDTETKKVHHDKEDHSGVYHDHGGHDKQHHDEKKHHAVHLHEEQGNKRAKYEESGKHSKGHSTKGSHDIHKKDEYEKKTEFFEEEGDSAEEEKHGGHGGKKMHSTGGQYKKGNLQSQYDGIAKGDSGKSYGGGHGRNYKAHSQATGHDSHNKQGSGHSSSDGRQSDKKWIYHHGHPAKTANLVFIDRRADQYQHGPQYYG